MTIEARNSEYSETLYMAMELGGSTWKLAFSVSLGRKPRLVSIPARDTARVMREITKAKRRFGQSESARVASCYEAGRDGHWLHRYLVAQGVDNVEVDPSSVSVDRRARRVKTDRLDAVKLLRHLIRYQEDPNEWRVVRVPSVEQEDQRHLHRELGSLKKERNAQTSRIKSLLVLHGQRLSVNRSFPASLAQLDLPPRLRARVEREYQRRELVCEQIRELERERRHLVKTSPMKTAQQTRQLSRLRGIGESSAWVFSSELFSWRELANRRQVGGLVGFTPTPYNSGRGEREQGISKAGLRQVRALAVEISWCWLRFQPDSRLSRWFRERFGAGRRSRKVGIVALARKLMIDLWRYVEYGVVPEGAVLKA